MSVMNEESHSPTIISQPHHPRGTLSPDARIIRPEDQPQSYSLIPSPARPVRPLPQVQTSPSVAGQLMGEMFGTILPAIFIAVLIHLFLAQATRVEGYSMEPTLYGHQRLIIEKLSYHFHPPQRDDIVVVRVDGFGKEMLIKRVIGLPGEKVEVRDGKVFINDVPLSEPYLDKTMRGQYPPTIIPKDTIFVMGDNRNNSNDSRSFGPVAIKDVVGRAWLRYWPLSDFSLMH